MEAETRPIGSILNTPSRFLSIAMTALRLSVPSREKLLLTSKDQIITLDEVSWHDNRKDCWVVIYDRIYDLTQFFDEHPGGEDVLLEYAGRDASIAFRGVGHSLAAIKALDHFQIGELPMHERIFRTPTGIILSNLPV